MQYGGMPRKPAKPKIKPLFSRAEVAGLCKRFLKEGKYDAIRDTMVMYQLLKQYPNEAFWRGYELGFTLNAMFWFKGKDGQERLARDWSIFNLDLGPQVRHTLEDTKVGEDIVVQKPKTSLFDFLQ